MRTLIALKNTNEQAVFARVLKGLAAQGFKRCVREDDGHTCLYQNGEKTMRCAVGLLFDDEEYENCDDAAIERYGEGVEGCGIENLQVLGAVPEKYSDLLHELQRAHDNAETPEKMRNNLRQVAYTRNLNYPKKQVA